MRENGLHARGRRRFIVTTDSRHRLVVCENILSREFHAEGGGAKWVSDITYGTAEHEMRRGITGTTPVRKPFSRR
jgi:transposase InsO family protein